MKYLLTTSLVLLGILFGQAQDKALPEFQLKKQEVEAHMRFLASDELQGRRTGEAGNQIAARYIASHLEAYGIETVEGGDNYLQPVALEEVMPIQEAELEWEDLEFEQGETLMMLSGKGEIETRAVFVNYGWVDAAEGINDYEGLDVKGKIVVTNIGTPDDNSPTAIFTSMRQKQQWAKENGAVGMIELFQLPKSLWGRVVSYFGRPSMRIREEEGMDGDFAYGWVFDESKTFGAAIKKGKKNKVELESEGGERRNVNASNVVGLIEGSDPQLRDEYVVLTAHYDHVGVGAQGGGAYDARDSIFNGARDNAFGTIALMSAAQSLAMERPKRSVIVLAVTGEELGLLGSKYYADNPLIPLNKTIFNFNTDGAGYNDKTSVSIIGLGRTGIDGELETAATNFGLKVGGDPAPEQGLFDRSDNVSFAAKGVPAVNFAPGMTAFDAAIMKYYHQVADNPDSIDYDYLLKYCQSFAHAARLIANKAERPMWKEGDKYEAAGQKLYKP
jgi:hypothetical protein